MPEKVRTAVFKNDLRVEYKKYPLSKSGHKIDIVSKGAGYFMPEIGPNTFLDLPIRKKYLFFGSWVYKRTYFVLNKGAKCVDFVKGVVFGPDQEQIDEAIGNNLAGQIGADVNKGTPWYVMVLILLSLLANVLLLNISGVFN